MTVFLIVYLLIGFVFTAYYRCIIHRQPLSKLEILLSVLLWLPLLFVTLWILIRILFSKEE
ncbi:MAG: hypothetical protein RLY43_2040 [Bacteroidota bacterium]|jgi:O-antigen ligase